MEGSPERPRSDDDTLFARARDGDQDAWAELVRRCWPKVLRVVRRKLNPPLRSLYDSTDFANDVFKSLVAESNRFDFVTFEALSAHLRKAAERKVIDEYRRQHRRRRDMTRVRRLGLPEDDGGGPEPAATDPTPSQVAVARETRERIYAGRSGDEQRLIELKEQDLTNEEVAGKTKLHVRKVQRLLKRVYESLRPPGERP